MTRNFILTMILSLFAFIVLAACSDAESKLRPVEEEQIENVVEEFVVRNESLPEYEVTIEAVEKGWARVSLTPAGVDGPPTLLYLSDQTETDASTTETTVQSGNDARVETTSGWSIVLGPQAEFSPEVLEEAGVPESMR